MSTSIDSAASSEMQAFIDAFNNATETSRETLFESQDQVPSFEQIIGQILMDSLFPHHLDPDLASVDDVFQGKLTKRQKIVLVGVAEHMGPDWTQALYHAAVFMTKVA